MTARCRSSHSTAARSATPAQRLTVKLRRCWARRARDWSRSACWLVWRATAAACAPRPGAELAPLPRRPADVPDGRPAHRPQPAHRPAPADPAAHLRHVAASTCPTRSSAARTSRARRRSRPTAPPISACTAARCSRCATRPAPATSSPRAGASTRRAARRGTPRRPSVATARSTSASAPTTRHARRRRARCTRCRRRAAGIEPRVLWSVDLGPGPADVVADDRPRRHHLRHGRRGPPVGDLARTATSSGRCRPARR